MVDCTLGQLYRIRSPSCAQMIAATQRSRSAFASHFFSVGVMVKGCLNVDVSVVWKRKLKKEKKRESEGGGV